MSSLSEGDQSKLIQFLHTTGRGSEDTEAWMHAIIDIGKSVEKIFSSYLPQALASTDVEKNKELLWSIREELRHIGYHVEDIEGR